MNRGATPRILALLTAAFIATLAVPVTAQDTEDPRTRKLKRQIGILETVINEILVESPNLLVSGRNDTHGVYLDEFGVLFALEASLVDKKDGEHGWPMISGGNWKVLREGNRIVVTTGDDDEDSDSDSDSASEENSKDEDSDDAREFFFDWSSGDEWREKHAESQNRLYADGKAELKAALVDYGETLTALRDEQWVAIAAFLSDSDYFFDRKISRLVLKVRMKDLRAAAGGRLSMEDLHERVIEEEY